MLYAVRYPNGLCALLISHTPVATHVETVYNTADKVAEQAQVHVALFVSGTGFDYPDYKEKRRRLPHTISGS